MTVGYNAPVADPHLLWREPAPEHFDTRISSWVKCLLVVAAVAAALFFLDAPIAAWAARAHPIPDLTDKAAQQGDAGRELMALEQWGQWVISVIVVAAVFMLDKAGRRRALAIALGCLTTLLVTYVLKELAGRSRPAWALQAGLPPGQWVWGGPVMGFRGRALWTSFPSGHATGAFALSSGLAWFYPRGRLLFMSLACITAAQRVLHHAHFLSDVIAGMGVAVFVTRWTLHENIAARMVARFSPEIQNWWLS